MKRQVIAVILGTSLLLAGCSNNADEAFEASFDGTIQHVHGMGYAGTDEGLYFASHTGLKIYRGGEWMETTENFNDYMGFNAVDEGFYTSGHPEADSDLPNPIGLQRSFDGGRSLESLAFEGETDFHGMAVGYESHDIFVMNPAQNSKLQAGFYRSNDEGETWESADAAGLEGEMISLAIHPSKSNLVAVAMTNGIYFSEDSGDSFQPLTEADIAGSAVFFSRDSLYYATVDREPQLIQYQLESGEKEEIVLPEQLESGVMYIAQHPERTEEMAIYTMQGEGYMTEDAAESWEQFAENGQVQ